MFFIHCTMNVKTERLYEITWKEQVIVLGKFYAVKNGKNIGIYDTWDECKSQVYGYPGAVYKSFKTLKEADEYMRRSDDYEEINGRGGMISETDGNIPVAFVDGSYNIKTKVYGYGGYISFNGKKTIFSGSGSEPEYAEMRNVAGEIKGSMAAIQLAIDMGLPTLIVYFDYMGIKSWANGDWKTNKPGTKKYKEFIDNASEKINIIFRKVRAHTGVDGNEEADLLAKKSAGIG